MSDTVDADGLTALEQAIARRLFQRWEDDFGNLTIQADPRDVALWLRPVLSGTD